MRRPAEMSPEDGYVQGLAPDDPAGDLKGRVGRMGALPEEEQRMLLSLLRGRFLSVWEEDLRTKSEKAKKRVAAARAAASRLGEELP